KPPGEVFDLRARGEEIAGRTEEEDLETPRRHVVGLTCQTLLQQGHRFVFAILSCERLRARRRARAHTSARGRRAREREDEERLAEPRRGGRRHRRLKAAGATAGATRGRARRSRFARRS